MVNFITHSTKLLCTTAILILLHACSTNNQNSTSSSISPQQSLELLLKQAQKAAPDKKSQLLLQASGLLVLEKKFEKSQEVLVHVDQQYLSSLQMDDFYLFHGETLLALGAAEASLNQLRTVRNPSAKSVEWQIRYAQSMSDSYLANHNYFEAAKLRIELDDLISDMDELTNNNERIWHALNQIETEFLLQLKSDFNTERLNGWLAIAYINKRWGYHPEKLMSEIDIWQKRYPLHPSSVNQPEVLRKAAAAEEFVPTNIAILLPLSGKLANIGNMIHDGIIAAHYRSPSAQQAPQLNFYDTAHSLSPLTPYEQAIKDGADFVLGPLTKESLEVLLQQESISVPMLGLNRLDQQLSNHPNVYQFGLPIEDEAIQAALYAYQKGYRKAIAFLPDNPTGERAAIAFKQQFETLGGKVIDSKSYREFQQLKNNVQQLLGVDRSVQRKQALQQLLGRNLEFEMRRRQDADFIFMVATPSFGRSIKPFIDLYFAHDLPVIATSSIYSGKPDPQTDLDLNGIEFPGIPLMLSEQIEFKNSRATLASTLPDALDARGIYFALGYDSYQIISQLSILQAFPEYRWNGLGGELGVDEQGLVHRYLTWAKFKRGVPQVSEERKIKRLDAANRNDLKQPTLSANKIAR